MTLQPRAQVAAEQSFNTSLSALTGQEGSPTIASQRPWATGREGGALGERIGAYEIREELGRGGMAVVYKAYQPALDRTVAIKLMLERFGEDPTYLARF